MAGAPPERSANLAGVNLTGATVKNTVAPNGKTVSSADALKANQYEWASATVIVMALNAHQLVP